MKIPFRFSTFKKFLRFDFSGLYTRPKTYQKQNISLKKFLDDSPPGWLTPLAASPAVAAEPPLAASPLEPPEPPRGLRLGERKRPLGRKLHATRSTNTAFISRRNPNNQIFSLIIHIKATFNNTILTLTNLKGQVITWASAGSCGFKGARKGTPFAAKKVVEIFIRKSNDYLLRCDQIKIYVSGVGPGRENAIRGLAAISKTIRRDKPKGGSKVITQFSNKIVLIREMTKTPHNGCRPTKKRRI